MNIYSKCFKIFLLISFLWIVACLFIKLSLRANETTFNTVIDDKISYLFEDKITKIIEKSNYTLYISNKNSYLYQENLINTFNEQIIDFACSECIYLLTNKKILKYNFKTTKEIEFNEYLLFDIYTDEKYIYACGMKNNNALVIKLNQNLEVLEEIELGGLSNERFVNVYVKDNIYYLIGIKDSISLNSPFKNVGEPNTEKVFMIMYYDGIINEIYFNTEEISEELINVIYKDNIYILLSSKEIFTLDYNFKIIPSIKFKYEFDNIFVDVDSNISTFKLEDKTLYINNEYVNSFEDNIILFNTNNNVTIYTSLNSKITKYSLFIYQIIENSKLILDKNNFDYHTLDNLKIYSPFEKIEKTLLESTLLNKQIHGIYNVTYLIKRPNSKYVNINGTLEIKPFVNISNNSIYKKGKQLFFFGKAYLNEKEIYNGHVIENSGEYQLKLYDNNYNETIYHFKVIDGYYKDCEVVDLKTDYEIKQNEVVTISLLMKNFKEEDLKEIIINDTIYDNYRVEENEIKIYIPSKTNYSIDNYKIDKVILNTGEQINIDETISIKTLKKDLDIKLDQSLNSNKLILDYTINDLDKSIMFLKTNIYENTSLIKTFNNYFNEGVNLNLQDLPKNNLTIEQILVYNNGSSLKEINLLKYDISTYRGSTLYEMNIKIDSSLKNITISMDYTKVKLNNLIVNETNILKNITIPTIFNDNTKLYLIILGSFIIFSFSLIFLKIRQKRKKKQTI